MLNTYIHEVWLILLELSPPLIVGLLIAGALHVLLPPGLIHRLLNKPGFRSTLRAVTIGVPMPLCSCGVLPTALGLRREGASNGATTGFLISTPQTGIDSILVSSAFLGWPFAIFKLVAAFVTGLIGGMIADRVVPADEHTAEPTSADDRPQRSIREIVKYAVVDLYGAIYKWIVIGILIAAAISTALPPDAFTDVTWAQGLTGMLIMLSISVPLYICATGSVPIAASLVAAGMPTGTALVFLMAGPATNIATLGAVYRTMGGKLVAVYLGTVIVMSITLGLTFDFVISGTAPTMIHEHGTDWPGIVSGIIIVALSMGLFVHHLAQRQRHTAQIEEANMDLVLKVEGMTCQHCVSNVKSSLEAIAGIENATPDLDNSDVSIQGDNIDEDAVKAAIVQAGYTVVQ